MLKQNEVIPRRTFVKSVGVTGTAALLLGQNVFSAHAASATGVSHDGTLGAGINILLVHGAFVDASSWNKVIPLLQSSGFSVLAVQNPLTSFDDDLTTTNQALASLSGPTILVGHSYGGKVISSVGRTAKNLIGMVFIAAYAPEEGESMQSINAHFPTPPAVSHIIPSYRSGFVWLDPPVFPQNFIQDVNATEARALAVAQKPIVPACFEAPPSGTPTWKRVPSWYLVSTDDRVIHPDTERFMAKRMGPRPVRSPRVTRPRFRIPAMSLISLRLQRSGEEQPKYHDCETAGTQFPNSQVGQSTEQFFKVGDGLALCLPQQCIQASENRFLPSR